jgi:hypothetical protein
VGKVRADANRASGRQLDHVEIARDLTGPAKEAERIVDSLDPPVAEDRKAVMTDRVVGLLRTQRELAVELRDGYGPT